MAKLVFGCGYLGFNVSQRWLSAGHQVYVVTRSPERAQQLAAAGFQPIVSDLTQRGSLVDLPHAETVLVAVGNDGASAMSMRDIQVGGLKNVLDALPEATARVIYISSTGVFGQTDGQWVDESSACNPSREGGQACLEAERLLGAHRFGDRGIILRLAGLYGPGRIPRRDALLSPGPLVVESRGYLNLIHVDDAANIVIAAESTTPPELYLVSDGQPVLRSEYYRYLAELFGADEPHFQAPSGDSPAARRSVSDKRVANRRMLSDLNVKLKMPSYREGLAAIVAEES